MKLRSQKGILRTVEVLLSLVFVAVIFHKLELEQLGHVLKRTGYSWLVVALLTSLTAKLIGAYAWRMVLSDLRITLSLFNAFRIRTAASFIAAFFPSQIGILSRAVFLNSLDGRNSVSDGISTILLEKLVSSLIFAFITGAGLLVCFFSRIFDVQILSVIGLMFFVNLTVAIIIALSALRTASFLAMVEYLSGLLSKIIPLSLVNKTSRFVISKSQYIAECLGRILQNPTLIAKFSMLTLINFFLGFSGTAFFIFKSLGVEPSWILALFLPLTLTSIRVLPISFHGIGLTEGVGIVTLSALSLAPAQAAAFMFLYQILTAYIFRLIGGFFVPNMGFKSIRRFREIRKAATMEPVSHEQN